jgi:3-methyladenine DNA glycosylase/8-oxoguanine DNA glycosylase
MISIPLIGAGGEPVSFVRAVNSHGLLALPPGRIDAETPAYELSVRIASNVRRLRFTNGNGALLVAFDGASSPTERRSAKQIVRRMFRLDYDLSPFYAMIANDERLSWAVGAGRLLSSPTVFEDIVKTICTTNCAWSATTRMVSALVELGGGAFPDAQTIAATPERWFADVARMGYRGPYVRSIAREVARGHLDVERLILGKMSEDDVEAALLELPGVGPYAAAHVMQLLGLHSRLVLDSWTRPRYLELTKRKRATDRTIVRDFARYGRFAGLAFWLYLTRDWVEEEPARA